MDKSEELAALREEREFIRSLRKIQKECHSIAKSHGWWDKRRTFGDCIALIHSELSEALDAYRHDEGDAHIKEELADAIIRILDFAEKKNYDLGVAIITKMDKNRNRPYRHGGLKL